MDEQKWLQEVSEKIKKKMLPVVKRNVGKVPYNTVDGVYNDYSGEKIGWWTNGFWGGILWQMYHATGEEIYKTEAISLEEKLDAVLLNWLSMDHDSGFKWLPTAVVNYRLHGDAKSKNRGILAADNLAGRFNPVGKYIKAWNDSGDGSRAGWAIIDCMMNIPLLYWAHEVTSDPKYMHIATMHADTAMKHFIREDGSVKHIIEFDPMTGEYLKSHGGQGYGHGSSWTRGQTWAIYGFALSYIHTGKKEYLDTAKKVADYFIANIPEDGLIPIDFRQPEEPHYEDSMAAAIAACGMIEIAKQCAKKNATQCNEGEAKRYYDAAILMLRALDEKRSDWSEEVDHILLECAEGYHIPRKNMSIMYGDYYFIEAIFKLTGEEIFLW